MHALTGLLKGTGVGSHASSAIKVKQYLRTIFVGLRLDNEVFEQCFSATLLRLWLCFAHEHL